jgi:hypothetical protein
LTGDPYSFSLGIHTKHRSQLIFEEERSCGTGVHEAQLGSKSDSYLVTIFENRGDCQELTVQKSPILATQVL